MPTLKAASILIVITAVCAGATAAAQTDSAQLALQSAGGPAGTSFLLPEQVRALQEWIREYEAWKIWFARWANRPEPGWFSTRARRQEPVPPAWLPEACAATVEIEGLLAGGCRAWREWRRNDVGALLLSHRATQNRDDLEAPRKSKWWQHVHVDALWPMTQTGSRTFGLFGMHTTIPVAGRFQVFLTPGVILMRVQSADGRQTWTTAADWGFSYRVFDFRMPVTRRGSTLNFNIARVWILGGDTLPGRRELYLAGFSVNFRPRAQPPSSR